MHEYKVGIRAVGDYRAVVVAESEEEAKRKALHLSDEDMELVKYDLEIDWIHKETEV